MALSLDIQKADVETQTSKGSESRAHRYSFLKVNEVSIVTEPAILSQKEADDGVGFPIVKFEDPNPEKKFTGANLSGGEDLTKWLDRLVSEARLNLAVATNDGDNYHFSPVKVFSDYVIMTDPYKNPLDNDAIFFKMTFSQGDDGSFIFNRPIKLQLNFAEESVTSKKLECTRKEIQMTELKGIEIGGQVLKLNPMPGLEFSDVNTGELIFRCDEGGVLHTGDGYVVHEDGIIRAEISAEKVEDVTEVTSVEDTVEADAVAEPVAEISATQESEAQKFFFTIEQLKELMADSGQSFKFNVLEGGGVEISPCGQLDPKLTVPMPDSIAAAKSAEIVAEVPQADNVVVAEKSALEARLEALEVQLTKAQQQLAGSSTTDPEVGENAVKVMGITNYPHEASIVPIGGDNLNGVFTRHIDKRLLDRRSRLQADLISG